MAKSKGRSTSARRNGKVAERYTHPDQTSPMRPDVGTQAQFRKKKPPKTYRYDSSLSPALAWDGQNGARELGEWLLGLIEKGAALPPPHTFHAPQEFRAADGRAQVTVRTLDEAVAHLKRLSGPFLDWAGKGRAPVL
jgi:adenine-specific DNA-methyltransferase